MVTLNLSSDTVRSCEETTMFLKECKKKDFHLKNPKSLISLKKRIRKIE